MMEYFHDTMSTEHVEPTVTSLTIATEKKDKVHRNGTPESNLIPGHKWGRRDALYLFSLVLIVVAMAYRYTPNLTGEVAGEWWDPLFSMWALSWDTNTLLHAPIHLWQAQLLYPNMLTLSYSENLLGEAIFFAPFFLITHNPVLAYNITFYLSFLLCGTNMYIMARYYTGKPLAAFVAALIYAFSPYRLAQIDHIHIIAGEWIPLAFLYLDLALRQGRWRHWSLFALFYLLQLLSSIYYGIFLSYALLAYVIIRYSKPFLSQLRQLGRKYLKYLLARAVKPIIVSLAILIILVILMGPYLVSLHSGLSRSLIQTAAFSAFVSDYGFTAPFNWLYGISSYHGIPLKYDSEHYLFLGWTTLVLVALGILLVLRQRDRTMRPFIWTALVVFLFTFGPALQFATTSGAPLISGPQMPPLTQPYPPNLPMPWLLAYFVLPGLGGLRVPARLIGVLLMLLALLAAYAVAWLQDIPRQSTEARKEASQHISTKSVHRPFALSSFRALAIQCLFIVIPLALLLEATPAYLPVTHVPTGDQIPAVYQWLATHGGQDPIVELPIAYDDEYFTSKQEAWYDYYAIYHTHPIVNGWSGYRPASTTYISRLLFNFPSQASLDVLRQYHIRYVVLHLQLYKPDMAAALLADMEANPELTRMATFGNDSVWQVK